MVKIIRNSLLGGEKQNPAFTFENLRGLGGTVTSCFIDEETKEQRSEGAHPRSHSVQMAERQAFKLLQDIEAYRANVTWVWHGDPTARASSPALNTAGRNTPEGPTVGRYASSRSGRV
jgi:hypothetical protein